MLNCDLCGRGYGNRNSLTRHMHNHKKVREHECTTCGTIFYRRDLLSRHSKIHQVADAITQDPVDNVSEPRDTRRRCHTACEGCRAARVKCNGQRPCITCASSNKRCTYGFKSSRISHAPIVEPEATIEPGRPPTKRTRTSDRAPASTRGSHASPEEYETADELDHIDYASQAADDNFSAAPGSEPGPFINPDWAVPTDTIQNHQDFPILSDFNDTLRSSDTLCNFNTVWQNPVRSIPTWPALHEDMFFFDVPYVLADTASAFDNFDYEAPQISQAGGEAILSYGASVGLGNEPSIEPLRYGALLEAGGSESVAVPNDGLQSNGSHHQTRNHTPQASLASMRPDDPKAVRQTTTVTRLVEFAERLKASARVPESHARYWQDMSSKVQEAFDLEPTSSEHTAIHVLHHFVELYMQHFSPLWPLLACHHFDPDKLHPALYLTLTSIGAMYSGPKEGVYGTMIHEKLRTSLLTIEFELNNPDEDTLWLGQARLLTQVAALYFGQKRAFSCAQYLGGVLISQARRMNLFSAQEEQDACLEEETDRNDRRRSPEDRLLRWMHFEARKRLAFGILRAESYTSVLLNTRPLISPEEINLDLPCAETIWGQSFASADSYLHAARRDRHFRGYQFSDLVRIAMDCEEQIPSLEPLGFELLLFGLQNHIWRFSHDPKQFQRLTGMDYISASATNLNATKTARRDSYDLSPQSQIVHEMPSSGNLIDHLAVPGRAMKDLQLECNRLFHSLKKWKDSFDSGRTSQHFLKPRNSLLSSLMLYYTSFIRLYAPLEDLHLISYHLAGKKPTPQSACRDVIQWSQTAGAKVAVDNACQLWNLIEQESQRPEESRAKFNFLAFAGLHHAAVVLWAYASNHVESENLEEALFFSCQKKPGTTSRVQICKENKETLLSDFVQIYKSVSPSRWSSFAKTAMNLSQAQFPSLSSLT